MPQAERPEDAYQGTTDKAERRALKAAVLAEYRERVERLVARLVPSERRAEGLQVGLLGVLVALEKYQPSGPSRSADPGAPFWGFAWRGVRDEIRDWLDKDLFWRPRTRTQRAGVDPAVARGHMLHGSMDAELTHPEADEQTLYDKCASDAPTAEQLVVELQLEEKLHAFAETLSVKEKAILFSENGQCKGSRRHSILRERAAAALLGSDDDGDQAACCVRAR